MIEHPSWCDLATCTAATSGRGHHISRAVELHAIPPCPLGIFVSLTQGTPVSGFPLSDVPLVHLALSDDEGELCTVAMYLDLAHVLGHTLTRLPQADIRPEDLVNRAPAGGTRSYGDDDRGRAQIRRAWRLHPA